jgi:hypothetical protein
LWIFNRRMTLVISASTLMRRPRQSDAAVATHALLLGAAVVSALGAANRDAA